MSQEWLNKSQLAARLGESPKQIERYVGEGIPHTGESRARLFDWLPCLRWRDDRIRRLERESIERARPDDSESQFEARRARKMEAEAREAELRVAKMIESVITVEAHEATVTDLVEQLRAVLVNAPGTYSVDLERLGVSAADAEKVLEAIVLELTRAMRRVAEHFDDNDGSGAAPSAA